MVPTTAVALAEVLEDAASRHRSGETSMYPRVDADVLRDAARTLRAIPAVLEEAREEGRVEERRAIQALALDHYDINAFLRDIAKRSQP